MSKALQWTLGIGAVLIVAAVIFSTVWPLIAYRTGWAGGYGYGMMGPGHMFGGGHMLGGFGMPFFGIGMLLWPVLVIGLIVLGVVWLARSISSPGATQPPAATIPCAHCGRPLQAGWKACPYCGEKV
ncbi:MAG: zinc ribbon domain-containing protein [Chloroflexi bacterium]|nr:zinc ribbon domain-containing protein [Chloroflexota bacterium]MBI3764388.1 zinc ribbon domain-containing protein [Chloroflexota bacterium]